MTTFFETDLNVDSMDSKQLDRIALEQAGVVGGISLGFATRGNIAPREGYSFLWVGTGGRGNQGTLVLRGVTPRTRQLCYQGRVKRLMALGATYTQAARMDGAKAPYIREEGVIRAALATYQADAWDTFPGVGGGVNRWTQRYAEQFGDALAGLSAPRLEGVKALVDELKKLQH